MRKSACVDFEIFVFQSVMQVGSDRDFTLEKLVERFRMEPIRVAPFFLGNIHGAARKVQVVLRRQKIRVIERNSIFAVTRIPLPATSEAFAKDRSIYVPKSPNAPGLEAGNRHNELVSPRRATVSVSRTNPPIRSANILRSSSPDAWPNISFTLPKRSRPRTRTATAHLPGAPVRALGQPVTEEFPVGNSR